MVALRQVAETATDRDIDRHVLEAKPADRRAALASPAE